MNKKLLNILFTLIIFLAFLTMIRDTTDSKYFNKKDNSQIYHIINKGFI